MMFRIQQLCSTDLFEKKIDLFLESLAQFAFPPFFFENDETVKEV
jgi:hypothetical protein